VAQGAAPDPKTRVRVVPIPDWVQLVDWQASGSGSMVTGRGSGTRYRVWERQDHPERQERFHRTVVAVENEAGLQEAGNLTFHFDPGYEELWLHRIQVWRDGVARDWLDLAQVRVHQPEHELRNHLLTGGSTAVVLVEDLRVGDIIESASTVRGRNPAIGDHYGARVTVAVGTEVDHRRVRVLWTREHPLQIRQWKVVQEPEVREWVGGREYLWDLKNLPAVSYEDGLPDGYEPFPLLEFSDFSTWGEVVSWAEPHYAPTPHALPEGLKSLIAGWEESAESEDDRVVRALQYVQDEIRYTGVAIGSGAYLPSEPGEVFLRKYGDCKDKSVLLCAVLRHWGYEAWPALVNSSARKRLPERLPSPFAFDHVVVRLEWGGRAVWLDPTISHQGGVLERRGVGMLSWALVIRPGATELEEVVGVSAEGPQQIVSSRFDVPADRGPVGLTVTTLYRGVEADEMRGYLARRDWLEIGSEYLNFYTHHYPGVRDAQALEVTDDRVLNEVTVVEGYTIEDLWQREEDGKRWEAQFVPESMLGALAEPSTRIRTGPLGLPYPLHQRQELEVHLADGGWSGLPAMDEVVEHEAFWFRYRRTAEDTLIRFEYELESLLDELPAGEVSGYLKKVEAMDELLGDLLYRPDEIGFGFLGAVNWYMVAWAMANLLLAAIAAVVVALWRRRGPPPIPDGAGIDPGLQGLGGWLVLVGLGLCLGPLIKLYQMSQLLDGYFSMATWQTVASPQGENYHPLFGPLLIFESAANVWFLVLNLLCIGLFFLRRWSFPVMYILLMAGNALFLAVDYVWGEMIPMVAAEQDTSSWRDLIRAAVAAVIWISYIQRSKRVRATFVR
jgi:transglutaminase-like putative cysteine protease